MRWEFHHLTEMPSSPWCLLCDTFRGLAHDMSSFFQQEMEGLELMSTDGTAQDKERQGCYSNTALEVSGVGSVIFWGYQGCQGPAAMS